MLNHHLSQKLKLIIIDEFNHLVYIHVQVRPCNNEVPQL
jgi:hypothetical protein